MQPDDTDDGIPVNLDTLKSQLAQLLDEAKTGPDPEADEAEKR